MRRALLAGALAGALAAIAPPALAQSASDFRLPPSSTSSSAPRVQGPVDPDNPVISGPRPSPRPTPVQPSVATTAPPSTATAAAPQPTASAPRAATSRTPTIQRPVQPGAAIPQARTSAPTGSVLPPAAAGAIPTSDAPIFSTAPSTGPAPALIPSANSVWLDLLPIAGGGLVALLALVFGIVWWSRRQADAPVEIEFERPVVPAPQPEAAPISLPEPQLTLATPAVAATSPTALIEQDGLTLTLEARRMSASLMATTLSYRLTLANHSKEPLSALAIEGDMIAASATLPTEQQVAPSGQQLELRHALVELGPGESAEFVGDIRLPLGQITPIRAGNAAYFIPLARFRVAAGSRVLAQTFVVGELPADPAAALRPFRLDLGPRTYSKIGQRAVG